MNRIKQNNNKVLCFIDSLGAGGAQRQIVGLASMLHQRGLDVKVCYYHDIPFYRDYLDDSGVPHELISSASSHIKRIPAVIKYFIHERPNWVIAYLEIPSLIATFTKILCGRFRIIVSERNTSQHTNYKERIRFNIFRWADYVVPNAYSQEKYIKQTFSFLSNKIVTIPNFVDLDYFIPPTKRQRQKIPEIMIAASIWPSKNTLGFIDAVSVLKVKGYRFHISWYGLNVKNKEYGDQCQEKIRRLELEDYIELKEKTNRINECYQNADYFCLPSFYEGTPNVICEAMACGLPVVCSNVCDNSKYVIEGENGFLFDPLDTNSIVMSIEKIHSLNDSEYAAFCNKSREIVEQELSKEKFIKSYLSLLGL